MQPKIHNIELDLKADNQKLISGVVDIDRESNAFQITIKDGDSKYPLLGLTVRLVYLRPDGEIVIQSTADAEYPILISDNIMYCTVSHEAIACPGKVQTEIKISDDVGKILTVSSFNFYVRKAL